MSNIKISEMTEATTLNDSDLLTIVQGGTNKKITKQNAIGDIITAINNPTYTTTTGTDLTINNTRVGNIKFEFYGDTEQITTTGKNLFDISTVASVYYGTLNNGVITSSTNASAGLMNIVLGFTSGAISVPRNAVIYFSCDIKLNGSSTGTFSKLNDGNNGNNNYVTPTLTTGYQRYQAYLRYVSGGTISQLLIQISDLLGSVDIKNIMITTSENITYEPYSRRNNFTQHRFSTTCKISYRS